MQPIAADDLFGTTEAQVARILKGGGQASSACLDADVPHVFVLANGLAISVDCRIVRPSHLQCLLMTLGAEPDVDRSLRPVDHLLDAASGLTLWVADGTGAEGRAAASWSLIVDAGALDKLTAMTTPSLYGNKLRLTRFVAPIAYVSLTEGTPILDLMAGTGVVGRALAERHPVSSNDANPYAALLAGTYGLEKPEQSVGEILATLRPPFQENMTALSMLVDPILQRENAFLLGETDASVIPRYSEFLEQEVLPHTDGSGSIARLATERYANIYFGVGQTVEIDSLRYAINTAFNTPSRERDFCLTALLLASVACATGPHFAQPLRSRSVKALRSTIERRARSVAWEFDLALGRLLSRLGPRYAMSPSSTGDWRPAIERFAESHRGTEAAVYVDPPYSKLQYSRYYHVLNVLLAYDYPSVHGSGRYPPTATRFSSRFEYQPSVAKREFIELLRKAADLELTVLLSYSDTGFVAVDSLLDIFRNSFRTAEVYSERLRHHSQGRTLAQEKAIVRERIFVGRP